ncbi:thymidine phosphorylase family protein [Elongatibacter sediminis]|uniref:Putative thymidine phosphorylase n=1 Tax=Elongatibacter sediminis TaxID=3119006 RepID=A0AAW9R7M8_9GAMM
MPTNEHSQSTVLVARHFDIDTRQEPVIFLRRDSAVARSEGFEALSRVNVASKHRSIIATLVIVGEDLLQPGHAGLSDAARHLLDSHEGDELVLSYPRPVKSLSYLRSKIYGNPLSAQAFQAIMRDIVDGRYMDVHLSAFITACANGRLSGDEISLLTEAMVDAGERLHWPGTPIVDKHCIGGLPGNRTTPVVVAIAVARGLTMPKTSSRAITSPSGTADTMETLAPVDLDLATMRRVVEREGGCIAWGGSVSLSPADDILIRVERALNIDSEGQLIASVLSKKIAAGSTHVVIDIPVGPTAKVRDPAAADALAAQLKAVGHQLGLEICIAVSDGSQPVGRGIGPALEARDVLAVLQNQAGAPADLRQRSLELAGLLLETAGVADPGLGFEAAERTLDDGSAWSRFQAICEAQGGLSEPPRANYRYDVFAEHEGTVSGIDNRVLARVAKLAGAPNDKAAGLEMNVRLGNRVNAGDLLMVVHAESPGELDYSLHYMKSHRNPIEITQP